MEHLHHFGLSEDPFRNDHLERFLHDSPPQADARRRLDRAVRQGRGLILLTGPVGSGKTTVARALFESLEEEAFESRMLVVLRASADFKWLITRIAKELGVEEPASEREAVLLQVYEKLAIVREDGRHAVVIVDEAQALARGSALEEVSSLVKLEYDERRLLSVVLVARRRSTGRSPATRSWRTTWTRASRCARTTPRRPRPIWATGSRARAAASTCCCRARCPHSSSWAAAGPAA